MTQLINLQRRIKAVGATKKVTRAMRLIAVATYGKLKNRHEALVNFKSTTEEILARLLTVTSNLQHPAIQPTETTNANPLLIIISSTRGLCGTFNSNLIQHSTESLKFRRHQHPTFITIGKRARQFVTDAMLYKTTKNYTLAAHYDSLNPELADKIAQTTTSFILNQENPFSQITILSNKFKNLFIQNPTIQTIVPIPPQPKTPTTTYEQFFLWEQNPTTIINKLADLYLYASIRQALLESLLAENAARSVAMDNATSGAEKHMDMLISQHNRIRQSLITREVTELSSTL